MSNCTFCNKGLGIFEAITREIPEDNRGTCTSCHKIFVDINKRVSHVSSIEELEMITEEIIKEFVTKHSQSGIAYLRDYLKIRANQINSEWDSLREGLLQEQQSNILSSKVNTHKLTTGYDYEGYTIKEYIGIVSGETVLGTGFLSEIFAASSDLVGEESDSFSKKMRLAKKSAMTKMIKQSIAIGGNAIIGIDFDYINFSSNMIGVSGNGTSVIVEKRAVGEGKI